MSRPPKLTANCVASVIAKLLRAKGVDRVFGLCGGHIMPIWMKLDEVGITIVDVRDERAAVYMAHAYAELSGRPGVALVTAGPGVTNATTGIANAHISRAPVIVLSGIAPQAQQFRGALQDLPHIDILGSITRLARTVREPDQIAQMIDEAFAKAYGDAGAEPGPVFLDFPTDVLRASVSASVLMSEHIRPNTITPIFANSKCISEAAKLIQDSQRLLVVGGRGARGVAAELIAFLNVTGALFLDTGECKGIVPDGHPALVSAMRAVVMEEADLVITIGRKLDFQLGYGSPAVFKKARWIRIADCNGELSDNRRGEVEIFATPALALADLADAYVEVTHSRDETWLRSMQKGHADRVARFKTSLAAAPKGSDGYMHPNRLIHEVQQFIGSDALVVADGGDFLSFVRIGMSCRTYLDPGSLGCIGVGTAFGIGAVLAQPRSNVVVLTGDGSFGFNAMEIDTAVRHRIPVLIIVANNGAWQIEVHDQTTTHGKVIGTKLQRADHAAMARAFGAYGEQVNDPDDLQEALRRAKTALRSGKPALLDVLVSGEPMSSDAKTGLAWVPDLQALSAWDASESEWRKPTSV